MSRLYALFVLGLASLALGLSACGDEEEQPPASPSPAALAPPDVPVFVEAVVRPEGDQREELEGALSKLLATDDPGQEVIDLFDDSLAEENPGASYERDFEPWLGERAGVFFSDFGDGAGEEANGAFIVETTDTDAALDSARRLIEEDGKVEEASYQGTSYLSGEDEAGERQAAGIVGDYLVGGSVPGFEAAVDASEGESLADSEGFSEDFEELRTESVAAAFGDPGAILDALVEAGEIEPDERRSIEEQLGVDPETSALVSLDATASQISLEASAGAAEGSLAGETSLLEELPEDAWLAASAGDVGEAVRRGIEQLDAKPEALPPELFAGEGVEATLERELGLDLREDILSWVGDLAVYMRGTSIFGLGAALIVETTDEEASAAALDKLRRALEREPEVEVGELEAEGEGFTVTIAGAPVQFPIVQREGKVVVGLGNDSIEDAFEPDETLGDSESFGSAVDALGEGWASTLFLDFDPVVELIESIPQASADPDYEQAKPYLEALDYLVGGQREEDGRTAFRLALGLREGGESSDDDLAAAVVRP